MSPYIDVMSYLLAVLTFSVGFLSTRRHAHVDVRTKDIADRSWKIRQALAEGRDLGPTDLAEDIEAIRVEDDAVVPVALWVNRFIFGSVVAVWFATFSEHITADASFLNLVVMASAVAVWILGEFDMRKMAEKESSLAVGTILGQLEAVDLALRSKDPRSGLDDAERLVDAFPDWVYARELELAERLAVEHQSGTSAPADGESTTRDDVHQLIGDASAHGRLHATAFLVAEERIGSCDPSGALRDFAIARSRSAAPRSLESLECLLNYLNSAPRPLLNGRPGDQRISTYTGGLEIGLGSLPNLRRETQAFRYFRTGSDVDSWGEFANKSVVFDIVRFAIGELNEAEIKSLIDRALEEAQYEGGLNTLGVICLVRGRDHEALQIFENAIRARPNSSTSHWGRAVACARRDWIQTARESLVRSASLEPSEPAILDLTEQMMLGDLVGNDLDHAHRFEDDPTDFARVQMAALGLTVVSPTAATGLRRRLVDSLIESAFAESADAREPAIA